MGSTMEEMRVGQESQEQKNELKRRAEEVFF